MEKRWWLEVWETPPGPGRTGRRVLRAYKTERGADRAKARYQRAYPEMFAEVYPGLVGRWMG